MLSFFGMQPAMHMNHVDEGLTANHSPFVLWVPTTVVILVPMTVNITTINITIQIISNK